MPASKKHTHLITSIGPKKGMLRVAHLTLGDNYLIMEDLENERYNWLCLTDDIIIVRGFASYTIRGNIATIADVAIDPEWQGYGWGSYLIATILEILKPTHIDIVRCPAWETATGGVHLEKALLKNGFKKKERVLRTPEDARSDFSCPVCGPQCKCYMVIYETVINNCYGDIQFSRETTPV